VLLWEVYLAVATTDGISVCDHLARSAAFVIIQIETGERTVRRRSDEACGNHATFVQMLQGCDAVICGGIGKGAADSLTSHNIKPMVLAQTQSIEEALTGYRAGTLKLTDDRVCLCG
jgi:predicted Fe-Mo cluster-binding NifX family protein